MKMDLKKIIRANSWQGKFSLLRQKFGVKS